MTVLEHTLEEHILQQKTVHYQKTTEIVLVLLTVTSKVCKDNKIQLESSMKAFPLCLEGNRNNYLLKFTRVC